jgi:hypothetical protein
MTTVASSLVEGIAASLIAVIILEAYRITRRSLSHRAIRRILGGAARFGIVAPSYPQTRTSISPGLLTTDNAFALAELIDACRKVGAEAVLSPVARIADNFPDDLILLGGHIANDLTRQFLNDYCVGFRIHGAQGDSPEQALNTVSYGCGRQRFIDTDQDAWAFIAKISSDLTHIPRTVVMAWGRSSFGSAAAAHLLASRSKLLSVKGDRSFFYAFRMARKLHYQAFPAAIIDLTDEVFGTSQLGDEHGTPTLHGKHEN